MKPSFSRRSARHSRQTAPAEGAFFRKEMAEPAFFDTPVSQPFFSASQSGPTIQRKCEKCEEEKKKEATQMPDKKKEEDKKLQRKEAGASPLVANAASLVSPGAETALSAASNNFFSEVLGRNFSDVKIHTGPEADRAAKSVQAKAYTLGNHIVFAEGKYKPESSEGKRLLAHELTHVVQQNPERLSRAEDPAMPAEPIPANADEPLKDQFLGVVGVSGKGTPLPQSVAYANCAGASVSGLTVSNYDHGSFSVSGAAMKRAKDCKGCAEEECVSVSGFIVHTFTASPAVTLPSVPPGNWSECEKKAIQTFIDTTLSQHEQQHVTAFKTYNGTVKTPFSYTGCKDGLNAHVAGIHDGINSAREAAATAKSDLLDANGANQFTIACDCPDPKPKEGEGESKTE